MNFLWDKDHIHFLSIVMYKRVLVNEIVNKIVPMNTLSAKEMEQKGKTKKVLIRLHPTADKSL